MCVYKDNNNNYEKLVGRYSFAQLAELVGLKVAADGCEVEDEAEQIDCPGGPEGAVVAKVFGEQAANEHAQTYAGIPGGKDG